MTPNPAVKTQLATLCYLKKEGKTLLLLRNKKKNDVHRDKWNGLGGKFLPGETPEECAVREVREEAGIEIENPRLRGVLTFPQFTPGTDWVVFVFTVPDVKGEPSDCREGELRWIPDGDIMDLNVWEGDRIFLRWLEEGRFFSGKFVYKDKILISHSVRFYDNSSPRGAESLPGGV